MAGMRISEIRLDRGRQPKLLDRLEPRTGVVPN
jgi:hypothetical protein